MANSDACKVPLMRMGIVNRRDDEGAPSSPRHWMVSAPATVTGERGFGQATFAEAASSCEGCAEIAVLAQRALLSIGQIVR
jgi:hypothetical protein